MFLVLLLQVTINFLTCPLKGTKSAAWPQLVVSTWAHLHSAWGTWAYCSHPHSCTSPFHLRLWNATGECREIIKFLPIQSCRTDKDGLAFTLSHGPAHSIPWWWPDLCVRNPDSPGNSAYERWLGLLIYCLFYFTDNKTEAQSGWAICPRSQIQWLAELKPDFK